ncbi:hypothetical protein QN345_01145 [Cryobacterium sp. 10I1]|uniref:hypothetical protein n=1 Tax=unclassified Cryobacterium TaxID=2649013 RepID=UPI002B22846F|nr:MULTISPECIES: hypothetical protein [unclassified Cryobacterium]MEB0001347.1 hypothetical protein [Cryobacterium sp. RTC2.1]MEB0303940.1 hypothetical protein [Cryobacterium sp. 10I1]
MSRYESNPGLAARTVPRWLIGPQAVHYFALVASFVLILFIGRTQWFFGDDWAILAPRLDTDFMLPHVGHWNLIPAVLFPLLRNSIGLDSYLPFLALAVIAHLAVVHVVWRILSRIGVLPWLATLLSIFLMLLGAASENLLWAFQFGFMGAIALGLGAILLLDRKQLTITARVSIIVLSVLAPMFSGTAIPVLVAAGLVGWFRHGFRRTAFLLLPAAVIYLSWYWDFGRLSAVPASGIHSVADVDSALQFFFAMFGVGFGHALPLIVLGVIPCLAVVSWFFVSVRIGVRSPQLIAYALAIGSVVFAALTTYSRMNLGISTAGSSRYAYVLITLLVPAFGVILNSASIKGRVQRALVYALVLCLIGFNAMFLRDDAHRQADREATSRARIEGALTQIKNGQFDPAELSKPIDDQWSPDLLGSDLTWLYEHGQITPAK